MQNEAMHPPASEVPQGLSSRLRSLENRIGAWALFVAITASIAVIGGTAFGHIFNLPDVAFYLKIAKGDAAQVLQPFASRQLGPLVCRAITSLFHISVDSAFLAEGLVSLLVLSGVVSCLLLREGARRPILIAVGGLATWAALFNGLALPDLWFAAFLSIFLLLLYEKHFLAAALLLYPLFLSRESTILVLVCLLIAGWQRMRSLDLVVAIVASLAGIVTVKMLAAGAMSNGEQLSPLLYMAAKVPWNLAKNVLGLPLWSPLNSGNCAMAKWQIPLDIPRLSGLGVCGYEPVLPAWTLRLALSCFGLLPLLAIFLSRKIPRSVWGNDVLLRFCALYGALSFVIAPALGSSVPRLFNYAWPLFIVAAPMLAARHLRLPAKFAWPLVALHLVVAWSAALNTFNPMSLPEEMTTIVALACAYVGGWLLLRHATLVSSPT